MCAIIYSSLEESLYVGHLQLSQIRREQKEAREARERENREKIERGWDKLTAETRQIIPKFLHSYLEFKDYRERHVDRFEAAYIRIPGFAEIVVSMRLEEDGTGWQRNGDDYFVCKVAESNEWHYRIEMFKPIWKGGEKFECLNLALAFAEEQGRIYHEKNSRWELAIEEVRLEEKRREAARQQRAETEPQPIPQTKSSGERLLEELRNFLVEEIEY